MLLEHSKGGVGVWEGWSTWTGVSWTPRWCVNCSHGGSRTLPLVSRHSVVSRHPAGMNRDSQSDLPKANGKVGVGEGNWSHVTAPAEGSAEASGARSPKPNMLLHKPSRVTGEFFISRDLTLQQSEIAELRAGVSRSATSPGVFPQRSGSGTAGTCSPALPSARGHAAPEHADGCTIATASAPVNRRDGKTHGP